MSLPSSLPYNLLASRHSLRWSSRELSRFRRGGCWLLRACTITYLHPLSVVEAEALSSCGVLLSPRSAVLWPPPTSHAAPPRISLTGLYQGFPRLWTPDRMRSPLFYRLLSQHSAPPTPDRSSRLLFQMLRLFHGLRLAQRGSTRPCPFRVNISTLQDSLDVTDCCFASRSPGDTPLQHPQSPESTGSLLRGALALTTTGLTPASRR